jgi:hypothetical protein
MEIGMQIIPARLATLFGAILCTALFPVIVSAEPVGRLPELNHMGEQMLISQGHTAADLAQEIPASDTVGVAVFPGSLYTGEIKGSGMMPSVVLASVESLEKVKEWYAKRPEFSYEESFKLFYLGDEYVMMESESVYLQDISESPETSAGGLMFNMADMKTQITISYKPKKSTDNE